MTGGRVRRWSGPLLGLVAGGLTAHVIWSAILATALAAGYRHRVFDVRRWGGPTSDSVDLVSRFFAKRGQPSDKPQVLFLGSSFTYGYPWQEDVIYSHVFASLRTEFDVLNVSVIGIDASFGEWLLCRPVHERRVFDTVFVEIPVINETARLDKMNGLGRTVSLGATGACRSADTHGGYFAFFLRHPYGLGLLPFVWDDKAYPKRDEKVGLATVPDDYFVTGDQFQEIAPLFAARVEALVRSAKVVGRRVYVYPTPVYLPGVRQIGRDADAVRAQLDSAVIACQRVPGVTCLDPSAFYESAENYLNITHLNQRGHRAMAKWFSDLSKSTQ